MSNEEPVDKRPPARPKEPLPPQKSEFQASFEQAQEEFEASRGKQSLWLGIIFSILAVICFSLFFGDMDATEYRRDVFAGVKEYKLATCSFMDSNPVCEKVESTRWMAFTFSIGFLSAAAYSFFIYARSSKESPESEAV